MWHWWAGMLLVGLVLGCMGAWTTNAARVFMKTLAPPVVLVAARFTFARYAPPSNSVGLVFLDFVLIGIAAFAGDYLLGIRLGRHGRDGYRHDNVGH